jgi:hypothetical protein
VLTLAQIDRGRKESEGSDRLQRQDWNLTADKLRTCDYRSEVHCRLSRYV